MIYKLLIVRVCMYMTFAMLGVNKSFDYFLNRSANSAIFQSNAIDG